jgi:hypothetical protein
MAELEAWNTSRRRCCWTISRRVEEDVGGCWCWDDEVEEAREEAREEAVDDLREDRFRGMIG